MITLACQIPIEIVCDLLFPYQLFELRIFLLEPGRSLVLSLNLKPLPHIRQELGTSLIALGLVTCMFHVNITDSHLRPCWTQVSL